jgi:hypothetical protein
LRKIFAIAALILTGTFIAGGQNTADVLNWKSETSLRTYLLQKMHQQYDARRALFERATLTTDGIADYIKSCRERYLGLLETMPEKAPLNPVVTGKMEYDDYSIENVIYESRPGHHVTSNIYIPSGGGPFPAVLFFCGHEMTSKATESYQQTAILFVRNGFVVLVVDPVSQGERVQFTDTCGNRLLRGSTTEHTLLNAGALLTGNAVAAWELYDNVRSLDYLISRQEVDSSRTGCLGNSGGGAQTLYFAAFDGRIKVAAPCSFITSREREYEMNGTGDGCQQLPSEGREQLEIADYLMLFAPKPLLILAGRYDFVDYQGTVEASTELEKVYERLGEGDKFRLFSFDDGHGISEPKRLEAVRWFRKWLCNDARPIMTPGNKPLDSDQLRCTPAGQVTSLYPDEVTFQEVNTGSLDYWSKSRHDFISCNNSEAIISKLKTLLAIGEPNHDLETEEVATVHGPGYMIDKLIIRNGDQLPLPCIMLTPDAKCPPDTLVIVLDHRGKSSALADTGFIPGKGKETGKIYLLADLRGMGETAEKPGANDPKYYNSEYHNAVLSLHTGQSLPGQRVTDILTLLDFATTQRNINKLPVKITATGPAASAALMAAICDNRITSLQLSATIRSFAEITERPMEKDWYSYIVPGIMKYFDLPDLASLRPDLKVNYVNN